MEFSIEKRPRTHEAKILFSSEDSLKGKSDFLIEEQLREGERRPKRKRGERDRSLGWGLDEGDKFLEFRIRVETLVFGTHPLFRAPLFLSPSLQQTIALCLCVCVKHIDEQRQDGKDYNKAIAPERGGRASCEDNA